MIAQRPKTVLVVDDDEALLAALARALTKIPCNVTTAHSIRDAKRALLAQAVDACIIDAHLGDGDGAELVRHAIQSGRAKEAFCITGDPSPQTIVNAMRAGFTDVLPKPIDMERLAQLVGTPQQIPAYLVDWTDEHGAGIVGEDEQLLTELALIHGAADTDCTVLITGESGTGKELVASLVHRASPRRDGPFVTLNCAAISESLIEAELFGHTRGAFTGAEKARLGRVAAANGGTLFLDEIGDLPLSAQAKLLRVLQNKVIMSVGADVETEVDVRVVAATHRNLEDMVERGEFRADLLFRLNVIQVALPPLRERQRDIPRLARHFVRHTNQRTGRAVEGLDASAEAVLASHAWPGNVRELMNVIERAVILKRTGMLTAADIKIRRDPRRADSRPGASPSNVAPAAAPPTAASPSPVAALVNEAAALLEATQGLSDDLNLRTALEQVERRLITMALERSQGNRTEAAALLGLNRTTLVEKMRKLV